MPDTLEKTAPGARPPACGAEVPPLVLATPDGPLALSGPLFEDPELRSLRSRARAYLSVGIPVHFRGRAGMGKTTLALHLAAELGRPAVILTGNAELTAAALVGREIGEDVRRVHDRYIQRVTRSESQSRTVWSDGPLTRAMAEGHTLVYDEFTRSTAETNAVLLTALEEGMLAVPDPLRPGRIVRAHPGFRAIFTSNPSEFAGVAAAPDALYDRMFTVEISELAAETEAGIVAWRTGLPDPDARGIVTLLRDLRGTMAFENPPSLRTALMIARVASALGVPASPRDGRFVQICLDALETRAPRAADEAARAAYLGELRRRVVAGGLPPHHDAVPEKNP